MTLAASLAIIILAALIHASFQLSVSVLTLLSGHAIGRKNSHAKLLRLSGSFVFGTALVTLLLLSSIAFVLEAKMMMYPSHLFYWAVACGLLISLGLAVWLFYYRKDAGTTLWIPRSLARYLADRAKATRQSGEAFGLGATSVFAEFLFILGPLFVSALALQHLPYEWKLLGLLIYGVVSLSFVFVVFLLIGGGHNLSRIQKWREENKRFMQFAGGGGLIVLGFFAYIMEISSFTAGGSL